MSASEITSIIFVVGFVAAFLIVIWAVYRPAPVSRDDKHLADLRKLVAELTELRDRLDTAAPSRDETPPPSSQTHTQPHN